MLTHTETPLRMLPARDRRTVAMNVVTHEGSVTTHLPKQAALKMDGAHVSDQVGHWFQYHDVSALLPCNWGRCSTGQRPISVSAKWLI